MISYKLDPLSFKKFEKATYLRAIPKLTMAMGAGMLISIYNKGAENFLLYILIMIPFIFVTMYFGLRNSLRSKKISWDSFELMIDAEKITRKQDSTPTIEIALHDVKEIIEHKEGHLHIKTNDRFKDIIIPSSVIDKDELITQLNTICTITKEIKNHKHYWNYLTVFATMSLMLIFYISKEAHIVIPTGIAIVILLLFSFYIIQKSKHFDDYTKKASYITFIVIISIILKLMYI